ncbi:MAG: DUF4125 family protein [Chloroflexi bacterium]|jgi:hypothetical protein|nr:DUF4125 family protein [Chloroflexota bacterium]
MDHQELLKQIIDLELDMFERVRTAEPSLCQERPEAFKSMRTMTHSVLSVQTLESYLQDLQQAKTEGNNLLTLKYARMGGQIPALKDNPIISEIVKTEERWMVELSQQYPHTIKGGTGFGVYLSGELETYSDKTLELYAKDVSEADTAGRNLATDRFNWLFAQIGYGSIAEAEEKARKSEEQKE